MNPIGRSGGARRILFSSCLSKPSSICSSFSLFCVALGFLLLALLVCVRCRHFLCSLYSLFAFCILTLVSTPRAYSVACGLGVSKFAALKFTVLSVYWSRSWQTAASEADAIGVGVRTTRH